MHKYKVHLQNDEKRSFRKPVEELVSMIIKNEFANYDKHITLAIGGPGGTGKSTFSKKLSALLSDAPIMRLDDYKTPRSFRQDKFIFGAHPEANNLALIKEHLDQIKDGKSIEKPIYNAITGKADKTEIFKPSDFNIIDGEISTYKYFRDSIDFTIFIDSDWKTQLKTRISRDIDKRKYTKEKAITTFLQSNLKEFAEFGAESKKWSDIHIYCDENYHLRLESLEKKLYQKFENLLDEYLEEINFEGLFVPVMTPFKENYSVDKKALINHIEFLSQKGVRRLLVAGTSSEFFSLTANERKQILRIARRYFPGIIVFQIGRSSVFTAIEEAKWAEYYGADAVMSLPPFYFNSAPADGIVEYYNLINKSIDLPLFLYNFPKHTGNPLTKEILAEVDYFGIKDSSGTLDLLSSAKNYFVGADNLVLQSVYEQAKGFIIGNSNMYPEIFVEMEKSFKANNYDKCKELQNEIDKRFEIIGQNNKLSKMKLFLSKIIDNYSPVMRPPLKTLSDNEFSEINKLIK